LKLNATLLWVVIVGQPVAWCMYHV